MLEQIFGELSLRQVLVASSILVIFCGLAWLLRLFLVRITRRLAQKTRTLLDDAILSVLRKPLIAIVILAGLYLAVLTLPEEIAAEMSMEVDKVRHIMKKVDHPLMIEAFNKFWSGFMNLKVKPAQLNQSFTAQDYLRKVLPDIKKQAESCLYAGYKPNKGTTKQQILPIIRPPKEYTFTKQMGSLMDLWKGKVDGKELIAIDTAGIRKKKQIQGSIEFYGMARAERSIRRADVVILLIDAPSDISQVDKNIGDYIKTQYKPCLLVVSKWDLAEDVDTEKFAKYVQDSLPGLHFAPLSFISSFNGENIIETIELAQELYKQANTRVSTAELNKVLEHAFTRHRPTKRKSKISKVYYATQVSVCPPTFVLFVNDKRLFNSDYERYLSNQLRDNLPFSEIPLKFYFRPKSRGEDIDTEAHKYLGGRKR